MHPAHPTPGPANAATHASDPIHLAALGWTDADDATLLAEPGACPARVTITHGNTAEVTLADGHATPLLADLAPHLDVTPVAGDWVSVTSQAQVVCVGARRTTLARPFPDGRGAQAIAANIDTIMIVEPIDREPSVGAIERMRIMAWDSGATPVLVLSKADACADVGAALDAVATAALGVDIIVTSIVDARGLDELRARIAPGTTTTMLGASGAGKTSLLNAVLGTHAATQAVRDDGQGRHTTSTRRLYLSPGGGAILDVPGIRSLDLLASADGVDEVFGDVQELALKCRFSDCSHTGDAGCAIAAALDSGELDVARYRRWQRVQKEIAYQHRRTDYNARQEELKHWKHNTRSYRSAHKRR